MTTQPCPNCATQHDVTVFVSGQRVLCKCGIRFEVKRTDVSMIRMAAGSGTRPPPSTPVEPSVGPNGTFVSSDRNPRVTPPSPEVANAGGSAVNTLENTVVRPVGTPAPALGGEEATGIRKPAVQLPGYELIDILGRGGMGEVWKARQTSLGRIVAVKILPAHLAADPEFVARFEKEATALASLSHPNIIQIIDRGAVEAHYYFAMEYVEGRSLRDVMNSGKMSAQDALKIIAQVCRAIDYAHEMDIIHRDLKPENILLDARGHVKVADFGLAGIRGNEPRLQLTQTSVAMGTLNYMAPEQRRDARSVDGRADLYSLGVMIYEMLTGDLPIGRFRLPSEKVPGLDVRVDEIVVKTLENDPAHRFQRASMITEIVDQLISGSMISSGLLAASATGGTSNLPRPATGAGAAQTISIVQKGYHGARVAFTVAFGLAVLGIAMKLLFGIDLQTVRTAAQNAKPGFHEGHGHGAAGVAPPNTDGNLFVDASYVVDANGKALLKMGFDAPGDEKMIAYCGDWKNEGGVLKVTQAGKTPSKKKGQIIPRAYVTRRYFAANELEATVNFTLSPLEPCYPQTEDRSVAELSFRVTGFQLSVFAIPEVGMRLGWSIDMPDGRRLSGNSSADVEDMIEDETPVPPYGTPFAVSLKSEKVKNGTQVTAFLDGKPFATKLLPRFDDRVAKLALGCRNLHCEFDSIVASGRHMEKPRKEVAEAKD